jgi:hypothetical protein
MLTVAHLELFKELIAVLLAYFPTVAFCGFFAAWVAKKLGDHTAERAGFLTLNPLQHINFYGLLVLLSSILFQFPFIIGFGRHLPLDEYQITRPYRKLKYLLALFAKSFANIMLICLATLVWSVLLKMLIMPFGLNQLYPNFIKTLLYTVTIFKILNLITALMELIFGLVVFIMSCIFPNMSEESFVVILLAQISLLILSWHFLKPYISFLIIYIDNWFGSILTVLMN